MAASTVSAVSLQGNVFEHNKESIVVRKSSNASYYFVSSSEYLQYLISHGENSAGSSIEPCGPAGSQLQVQTPQSPSDHDNTSTSTESNDTTNLNHAVLTGQPSLVKTLVKQCPSSTIDSTDEQGATPLICAAIMGAHESTAVLLKAGASPDISHSGTGATPLSLACLHGHYDIVKLLLKHRASLSVDHTSCSPLHYAVWGGSGKAVKILLSHQSSLVSDRDCIGRTSLHLAAAKGDIGMCQLLMKKGCVLTETDDSGRTPLHWAIISKQVSCVEYLIAKNLALCNQADSDGATPVHYLAMTGQCDMLTTLLKKGVSVTTEDGNGRSPLYWACACGHLNIVKELVNLITRDVPSSSSRESSTDQTAHESEVKGQILPDDFGKCLRVACGVGSLEVCQFLLNTSSSSSSLVNEVDEEGKTALYMASYHGHKDCVDQLLETGTQPDTATYSDHRASLHVASERGHCEVVASLLAAKANIYCSTCPHGERPIHLAARNGHSAVIIEILRRVCDPDIRRDNNGQTTLHIAAEAGHIQCCRLLIEGGANPALADTTIQRLTSLDLAMLNGHSEITDYLISVGAPSGGGKFHRAALTIQAVWRLHRHRRRERSRREWSVSVIQGAIRRWSRRRQARRVRDTRQRTRNRAARLIQSHWRLYIEGKRRYEASCARLRAKLHQEHLATSLLLDELYSQSHSICFPPPTSSPLSTRRLPATLLQASAPLPGARITSATLLSQTSPLPRSRPRKPLTRSSPRPKLSHPTPPSRPVRLPPHPLREEEEKIRQIRLPNISASQPLLLNSNKRTLSQSGQKMLGSQRKDLGGIRKSKSDTDGLLPTVTETDGLLVTDDNSCKDLGLVNEDKLPPLPETPSLVSPPPLSPTLPLLPLSEPQSHPASLPSTPLPPLHSPSDPPPLEPPVHTSSSVPHPPPESPLHTSPSLPSNEPPADPSTTIETNPQSLIEPDTSEHTRLRPLMSDKENKTSFISTEEVQSQAGIGEKKMEKINEEKIQITRPYLRQTMFRGSILGQSSPQGLKQEEKERKDKEEEERERVVDERLLGPIQRYDKLNQVLGLLQKVQVAEREGEEGLRLVDLHHHIQSALDEAVRLRADTETLHQNVKVKLEHKPTNSVQ